MLLCFQTLGCLLAVGVCWNQNWRKALGIHPGNKRAFVQEDLEDAAAFIAATLISIFSLPKSTCQRHRRRWAAARARGGMCRQEDGCLPLPQAAEAEHFPKRSCVVACKIYPSLSAKLHAPCPGSGPHTEGRVGSAPPCGGWTLKSPPRDGWVRCGGCSRATQPHG